jgi:hypothetical protein
MRPRDADYRPSCRTSNPTERRSATSAPMHTILVERVLGKPARSGSERRACNQLTNSSRLTTLTWVGWVRWTQRRAFRFLGLSRALEARSNFPLVGARPSRKAARKRSLARQRAKAVAGPRALAVEASTSRSRARIAISSVTRARFRFTSDTVCSNIVELLTSTRLDLRRFPFITWEQSGPARV